MHRTALHDWHVSHGGRMVDFAGWEMPIQYTSITEEHQAVRQRAGMFDIGHMGRLRFRGADACQLLDSLLTNNVAGLKVGQVRYSLICNEQGGILDDVLVYRLEEESYLLVVNASNRETIVSWIEQHQTGFDAAVADGTQESFMLALQGPRSIAILSTQTEVDLAAMKYYTAVEEHVCGVRMTLSRTGYTGEDGFELTCAAVEGPRIWSEILTAGEESGLVPCGLGCRDTLRLEAAMPLYGHELNESIDPLTAGLSFAVKLNAADFIGKSALQEIHDNPTGRRRVGLKLSGRRIAREGAELFAGDEPIGRVTSGTFSPTLEASIALGYVRDSHAAPGTAVEVDIRGRRESAEVCPLPFYKRS
jgi:aminomethyltransferase